MIICNVCGRKITKTQCKYCNEDLWEEEFYCFDDGSLLDGHFCSSQCWEKWVIKELEGNLNEAQDENIT